MDFEYKTIGGPERAARKRGNRTLADRVAAAMQALIRAEAEQGWEYLRTDLVPIEERASWLSRKQVVHCAVLVFRRPRAAKAEESRASLSSKAARLFAMGGGGKKGTPAREEAARAEPERHRPQQPVIQQPAMQPPAAPPPPAPPVMQKPPTPEQLTAEAAQHTQIRRAQPQPARLPPGIADYQPPPLPGWQPAPPQPQAEPETPAPQATGLFTRMQPVAPRAPRDNGSQP